MDRASAIEKIKKCLRLSRSNEPHEAAAALRQAQALMAQHGVDLDDVEASEIREVATEAVSPATPAAWEYSLATMVKECFACDVILGQRVGADFTIKGEWRFVGKNAYPEIAAYSFAVLRRQLQLARAQYIVTALRRCKVAAKRRRADEFSRGWVLAASVKAQQLRPTEEEQRAIESFMDEKYPDAKPSAGRRARAGQFRDRERGFEEGTNAELHRGVSRDDVARLPAEVSR